MFGSASNTKAGKSAPRLGQGVCPTLSRVQRAGGTAKVCADWAFVPLVSLAPPYLELIEEYRSGEWNRQGEGLVGATLAVPGQMGQTQQSRGFQGDAAGTRHRCNRDNTVFRPVKVQRYYHSLRRT